MASKKDKKPTPAGGLGELQTDLAIGTTHVASDLNMIGRAVREGWDVPVGRKPAVVDRLLRVVDKERCEVMTKSGIVGLDGPADSNAIKAASVLVAMTGEKQRDIHALDKNARLNSGLPTERYDGVNVIVPGLPTTA